MVGFVALTYPILSLAQQADINSPDETGWTPLMNAAYDGNAKEVGDLLKKGANIEAKDKYGWTALMYTVATPNMSAYLKPKWNSSRLKVLLENSANVNASDSRGITPLMIAAIENKADFVKLLLSKGASVNSAAKNGATALSYAKVKKHGDIVKLLDKAGASGIDLNENDVPEKLAPIDVLPKELNRSTDGRPTYTDEARRHDVQGMVRFRVLIGIDGSLKKVNIISGLPYGLTEKALQAVLKLKANPGINEGKPVEYWLPVQMHFAIY